MVHITLVGMGLIGTSLGMALRSLDEQQSPLGAIQITGYDHNRAASKTARERLAIDHIAPTLEDAVHQANLVVLATPVQTIHTLLQQLAPVLPQGAVVTDVASTKAQVCAWARSILPGGIDFVGGHPMAGSEQSGPGAATPDLFGGAIYCLTPHTNTRESALNMVEQMVVAVGARPYYLDPDEHDAYVAGISHLPFLLSTLLVHVTSQSAGWKEMSLLAASGFRDLTRLASGDPVMHRDICMTNRTALIRWINDTISALHDVREHLEQDDAPQVESLFVQAREVREAWLQQRTGLRPGEEAFYSSPQSGSERPDLFGLRWLSGRKRSPEKE